MKQWVFISILALALAGCQVPRAQVYQMDNDAWLDQAHHHTVTEIQDITDPEHPKQLARWEGNAISGCGIRNLMVLAITGNHTSMGDASGAAAALKLCQGATSLGAQKISDMYDAGTQISVGSGAASNCTASTTPFPCCVNAGQGCGTPGVPDSQDVALYAEGQVAGASANTIVANYGAMSPFPNAARLSMDAGYPQAYYNGTVLEGIQFRATADGATANISGGWCEYMVRTAQNAAARGPLDITGVSSGWPLNHALIPGGCITKTSGMVFQITVTITIV